LDEDVGGHGYKEEQKNSDTDDAGIKYTFIGPTPEGVTLRTKQLLITIIFYLVFNFNSN